MRLRVPTGLRGMKLAVVQSIDVQNLGLVRKNAESRVIRDSA